MRPLFILVVTGIFCLFGVTCLFGAFQNMGANGIHSHDSLLGCYPYAVSIAAAINGALFLACAYGIYHRHLYVWWAGFTVLVLGQTYSVIDLLTRRDLGNAHMLDMLFGLMSIVIASALGCWWYTKRAHFS